MKDAPVAVIGAGWAGLAAAVALVRAGRRCMVFDANPRPGGRARTAPAVGTEVDNGQHLAIGAYRDTLHLLQFLGVPESAAFRRLPLMLDIRRGMERALYLHARRGAGPLGLGWAFLTLQGLTLGEKIRLVSGWKRMRRPDSPQQTVAELLDLSGQPAAAKTLLWEPLCIATLNTPPQIASATIFARVLSEAFASARGGAADLLLPATDLGHALPEPAVEWLVRNGSTVCLGERITGLALGDAVQAVTTAQGAYPVSGVVLAVPADACGRLLGPYAAHAELVAGCERIPTQPICTIYLRYPESVRIEPAMIGFTDTLVQWLVDRRVAGQPGIFAAIVSADGPHMEMDNDALIERIHSELAASIPGLPKPLEARVIREKRATFEATPEVEMLRPGPATATRDLVLAGDWTATGLPATLEGAVRSGYAAAAELTRGNR